MLWKERMLQLKKQEEEKIGEAMRKRNQLQLKLNNRSRFQRSNDEHGPTKMPNIVYKLVQFQFEICFISHCLLSLPTNEQARHDPIPYRPTTP